VAPGYDCQAEKEGNMRYLAAGMSILLGACIDDQAAPPQSYATWQQDHAAWKAAHPAAPLCVSGGYTFTCEELRLAGMGIAPDPVVPMYIPPYQPAPVARPVLTSCIWTGSILSCISD
jgi:hypothetical protein